MDGRVFRCADHDDGAVGARCQRDGHRALAEDLGGPARAAGADHGECRAGCPVAQHGRRGSVDELRRGPQPVVQLPYEVLGVGERRLGPDAQGALVGDGGVPEPVVDRGNGDDHA
ncbi:hypothetical protein O1L60_40915 [Streptomyces diastatochromogenes]|nr:hypothetical protein [Streptomyces diastatochromogenes]